MVATILRTAPGWPARSTAVGSPAAFSPPHEVAQVKAVACELPKTHGLPLSRFSRSELHRFVVEQAVSDASATTIGRWLADDAIGPWQHRSWIFPRDPDFLQKAGPVLDLYAGRWEGKLLEPGNMVISADAKPSIQARKRIHPGGPPAPGRGQRVEHEYERMGAPTYLDVWDVRRGGVIGRSERKGGIAAFDRLVWQVMTKEPYASARRVFWIVDNGSDHRGKASIKRLQGRWPTLILVHLPVHASWLKCLAGAVTSAPAPAQKIRSTGLRSDRSHPGKVPRSRGRCRESPERDYPVGVPTIHIVSVRLPMNRTSPRSSAHAGSGRARGRHRGAQLPIRRALVDVERRDESAAEAGAGVGAPGV
ncbi:MAG: hypothetical protein WKF96_17540 [Solirubrobacteraceae bacterium]